MPLVALEALPDQIAEGQAVAGLDLGTKTIGLAVSDLALAFAHPRPVIQRTKFTSDAKILLQVIERERIGAIVIGLPVNMNGSEGPRAQSTRSFVRNLEKLTPVPIAFWDERLSTVAADRALIGMDVSRKRRAERIDSVAAAFILQGALDRLHAISSQAAAQ